MADFALLSDPQKTQWVISAPRRAKRPDIASDTFVCPFCPVNEEEKNQQIRVIPNKFPFAPIHEIIIHSPNHTKDFGELAHEQIVSLLTTYKKRYQIYQESGQVIIFHNRGITAGESIAHAHTQLVVLPHDVAISTRPLGIIENDELAVETNYFSIFCPKNSQWPDEVWIAPKRKDTVFRDIDADEINNLAYAMKQIVSLLTKRHEGIFPFNFFIYPGKNWYIRITPRLKILGGFEIATGIYINTQDPDETVAFLKQHFSLEPHENISPEHKARYHESV